ncbi:MAG: zinc protease, partial [Bacteroidota bacterium]|nr:zinc protease [Bacteroidota bacterium]
MKQTKIQAFFVLFTLIFAFTISAYSQINKSLDERVPLDPAITYGKLDNGLTYYIKVNHKPEKRMELRLAVKAGAICEDDDQNGLAHFCEHMAFNGTKNFPKMDLINFLESVGVRFGADLNAYTAWDQTVYMLELPTDKPELIDKGFLVMEDWGHNVAYTTEDIEKERGVIMEEWRLGKGAEDRCDRKHYPIVFYNSKYAKRDIIGDTAIISRCNPDALRRFYKDWYRPDLMAIIAVGDFDKDEVLKKIKEHFGRIKPATTERKREKFSVPYHKETLVTVATDKELSFPSVEIIFKHPERELGSYKAFRENIIDNLFTSMLNNRLDEERQGKNPPFVFAYSYASNFVGDLRVFQLSSMGKGEAIDQTLRALITQIFKVKQNGFTESEFDRAKKESLRFMEKAFAERDKTESRNYASEYIRNFLENESAPGIASELELYNKWLPDISLKEVNEAANNYIRKESVVISISAPEREGVKVPTEPEALKTFNEIADSKIAGYVDEVSDKPLFSKQLTPGKIVETKEIKDIGVTELKLSNGMRVVLKPTDFKNDEIQFTSFSPGGTSLATDDIYYSAAVASSIIGQSGISDFSKIQLDKMLTGKIVNVYPRIGELTESIEGSASPNDIETMFQLINLYFTEPRKDVDAFNSWKDRTMSSIKEQKNSPRSVFSDSIRVTMSQYHFRGMPW